MLQATKDGIAEVAQGVQGAVDRHNTLLETADVRYESEDDEVKWAWFFDCVNRLPERLQTIFIVRALQAKIAPTQVTGTPSTTTPP
jgi:hypothetical protein